MNATTTPHYELRKVKIHRELSEETNAFTAELWLDGEKIADVSNHGQGGSNNEYYVSKEAREAHVAYCASLPPIPSEYFPEGLKVDTDVHVSELLADYELTKTITRKCKNLVLWRLKGDPAGTYYQSRPFNVKGEAAFTLFKDQLRQKHGDKLELIFNDDIPAAVALLRKGQ